MDIVAARDGFYRPTDPREVCVGPIRRLSRRPRPATVRETQVSLLSVAAPSTLNRTRSKGGEEGSRASPGLEAGLHLEEGQRRGNQASPSVRLPMYSSHDRVRLIHSSQSIRLGPLRRRRKKSAAAVYSRPSRSIPTMIVNARGSLAALLLFSILPRIAIAEGRAD